MGQAVRKRVPVLPRHSDKPKKKSQEEQKEPRGLARESTALMLFALAIFLFVALYSNLVSNSGVIPGDNPSSVVASSVGPNTMGKVGGWVSDQLISLLGWCSFVTVLWAVLLGRTVWKHGWPTRASESFWGFTISVVGSVLMVASCAAIASVFYGYHGGGRIGAKVAVGLVRYVNEAGALLFSSVIFLLSLGVGTGIGTSRLISWLVAVTGWLRPIGGDLGFSVGKLFQATATANLTIGRIFIAIFAGGVNLIKHMLIGVVLFPAKIAWFVISPFRQAKANELLEDESFEKDDCFVLGTELDNKKKKNDKVIPLKPRVESKEIAESEDVAAHKKSLTQRLRISRGEKAKKIKQYSILTSAKKKPKSQDKNKTAVKNKKESSYMLPSLDLLVSGDSEPSMAPGDDELMENSKRLEQAFTDFRIGGKIVEVHPGPIITLYQFQPAAGVKVQRVIALADDLALALKVASVRVYAPVPGKGTVGIEVPNAHREVVRLRDILDSDEFEKTDGDLKLALAKTTFGEPYAADLARMPHLLIAGATGTGKSVCINSVLVSLLYGHTPKDLRFILIDPKMLELSMYENIPHLMAPVVTNAKRARGVLWWAVEEMERRYCMMKDMGVRNLASYNKTVAGEEVEEDDGSATETDEGLIELGHRDMLATPTEMPNTRSLKSGKAKHEHLPHIVIVVDELADLMLTVGREIEELITRLAQKARAAGIHLILATQRPSVNVITGLIKANFSARISFQVASRIDARTVLDTSGAEKLLGRGDMLFMAPGSGRIKRLHAPFVSDKEVYDVVAHIRSQAGPQYVTDIESMIKKLEESETSGEGRDGNNEEYDELYDQAVTMVIEKGHASTSMVQRAFRIGYNRAARILETMEREGIVGPADGAKPRPVVVGGARPNM